MSKILILETNKDLSEVMEIALQKEQYTTLALNNGTDLLAAIQAFEPHLLILEFLRKSDPCINLFKQTLEAHPFLPVIAFGSQPDQELDERFSKIKLGIQGFLSKPFNLQDLYTIVSRFMPEHTTKSSLA